jgi:nitrous oxide reductase
MIRDLRDSKSNRRKFLRDLAAAGGLAAVAGASGGIAAASATTAKQPQAQPRRSYRVTAHVSKYYDKARF